MTLGPVTLAELIALGETAVTHEWIQMWLNATHPQQLLPFLRDAQRLADEHAEMVIGVEMAMAFARLHPGEITAEALECILPPARLRGAP